MCTHDRNCFLKLSLFLLSLSKAITMLVRIEGMYILIFLINSYMHKSLKYQEKKRVKIKVLQKTHDKRFKLSETPLFICRQIVPLWFIARMLGFKLKSLCDCFLESSLICTSLGCLWVWCWNIYSGGGA
jgi:hypothetical protein